MRQITLPMRLTFDLFKAPVAVTSASGGALREPLERQISKTKYWLKDIVDSECRAGGQHEMTS